MATWLTRLSKARKKVSRRCCPQMFGSTAGIFILNLSSIVVSTLIAAGLFVAAEHEQRWTYGDSLYFCFTTMTTIGTGNLTPRSRAGRLVCCIYGNVSLSFPFINFSHSARLSALMSVAYMSIIIGIIHKFCTERFFSRRDPRLTPQTQARSRKVADCCFLLAPVVWLSIGAVAFHHTEGWSLGNSLYFWYGIECCTQHNNT